MNDQQWRESVRRDAIRCGNPPAIADYLAANVGKRPTEAEQKQFIDSRVRCITMQRRSQSNARRTVMSPPRARSVDECRRAICDMYSATALVPAFIAADLPLPRVVAILVNANAGKPLGAGGIANVRNLLAAQRHWAGRAAS